MSYLGDVTFSVYHGGYWLKLYNGEFTYLGWEMKTIESKPEEIFTRLSDEFSDELYGQKLWYTMHSEDFKERKSLCIGDESFEKMCEAARWVKFVDLFLVNTSEYPDDIDGPAPCEAEVRVERSVLNFLDEDEDFDYHNTPPNSDGEEEDNVYRWKRGSGQLKLRQVFDTLEDFKEALVEYMLKEGWNIELCRWGKDKSAAKCGIEKENCPWFIHCSYEEHIGKWILKVFEDEHSCVKDGYCKMLKSPVITKLFLDDWRTDLDIRPKAIQNEILKRFNLITTIDTIKKAKSKALEIIANDHEEQFSRLKDYRLELLRSNHESTVLLDTFENDDGTETFHRFYVCFAVIRRLWKTWCRPIFGLDGCFLKSTLKGQLLAAVGRDANNGMYPIAWAVVDVENEPNWCWFIQNLKADLNLQNGHGFTLISDRQKGLLKAVERELPMVEHRMCARHIYANLKKAFPHQSEMKTLFWRVAESYTIPEYEKNLEAVQKYDMRIFEAIMEKNPKNCSLAFCGPTASCVDVHNNISESFNNAIDPARYIPMVEMLEVIRRSAMVRIDLRKLKAQQHKSRYTTRATQFIALEQEKIKFCNMFPGSDGRCEVRECNTSFSLNLMRRTCSCRKWEMSGLPCRHALRVIADKKLNYEDYTSSWYANSRQQQIYSDSIRPVTGMQFWQKLGCVVKPPADLIEEVENRKGRKPKPKRKKGKHESPKKKVGREKRIMHCGRCGIAGHNATNCKNMGVPKFLKPRKRKNSSTREDGYNSTNTIGGDTSDFGDGPSQSTQH